MAAPGTGRAWPLSVAVTETSTFSPSATPLSRYSICTSVFHGQFCHAVTLETVAAPTTCAAAAKTAKSIVLVFIFQSFPTST